MRRRREVLDDKKVFGPADEKPEHETILTLDKSLEKKLDDMRVSDPYIGTTIDERYLLHEKLGAGGMGAVYRATHMLMEKPVAIKLISRELTHLPQVVGRFEREARSASRLSHPHCITVTDFGRTEDGTLFLVMELLDGEPLEDMLNRLGTLPPPLAIHFTKQILDGLSHAHEAGIVHRDLKPANVMIVNQAEKHDFAIVFDFGIAKIATDTTENKLTQQGMIVGTPAYISPEQALGDDADHRADLYAVGVMLYEMLTGDVPYRGAQAVDVVTMHISAEVPSLPPGKRYPLGLRQVIEKAMAKKPDDRFQTADAFLAEMSSIDLNKTEFIKKRKSGGRATVLGVLLGLLASAIAFCIWYYRDTPSEEPIALAPQKAAPENIDTEPVSIEVSQKPVADLLKKTEEQIRLGIPTEAVNTAKEAVRRSPEEPIGYLLLGHALFLSNKRSDAMDVYETALEKNGKLSRDERLLTHLKEALKWSGVNEKAAALLSEKFGDKGVLLLRDRANSPLSDRDERGVARKALISIGREGEIDWLATLTADFNDFKACAKRRQIVHQMEETHDPRFLPLLEAQRPAKGRWMKAYKCIEVEVERAIRVLSEVAKSQGMPQEKE